MMLKTLSLSVGLTALTLLGSGCIGLGRLPDPNASDVIRYTLEE